MNLIYNVFRNSEIYKKCGSLEEAYEAVRTHPEYKVTYYTRKGKASARNPDSKSNFFITDNQGGLYNIRP